MQNNFHVKHDLNAKVDDEFIWLLVFLIVFVGGIYIFGFFAAKLKCESDWKFTDYESSFIIYKGCMVVKKGTTKQLPAYVVKKYID